MASPRTEDRSCFFLAYLAETGLDVELRAICLRHFVSLRNVYLDGRDPTIVAARLECWFWLSTRARKSASEIARIFDRDNASVHHGLKKLREMAAKMNVPLDAEHASEVARALVVEMSQAGKRSAP